MMTKTFLRRALALALCASATAFAADAPRVAFPDGYRQWTHVKSMQILPGHPLHDAFGGLHHLYANRQAMAGYRSGRFPDGAVIAFDLLQAETANNAVTEGSRKVVGIMRKDARRFAATGGWGFEAWQRGDPKSPVVQGNAAAACFNCHTAQKDHDFVFSAYRP
jgi:cytochrome P460